MKAFILIPASVALGGLAFFLVPSISTSLAAPAQPPSQRPPPPAAAKINPAKINPAKIDPAKIDPAKIDPAKIDPAEVFQRAFWQPPGAGDHILHAERREWTDPDGLKNWQWFLVVEPSPELVKYLREDNAFGLVAVQQSPAFVDAPAWFTFQPGEVDVLHAPHGNLHLFFNKTKRLLLATSSGTGFRPGAPQAVKATS